MRNVKSLRVLLLGLLSIGLVGCLDVEAEVPDIEVTQRALSFKGTPISRLVGETSTTLSYDLNEDDLPFDSSVLDEVKAYQVKIAAADKDTPDLDFIRYLRVTIQGKNGAGAAELVNYERDESKPVGRKLSLKKGEPVDVTAALEAGHTKLLVEVAGLLPENDWAVDVSVKLKAKAKVKYSVKTK